MALRRRPRPGGWGAGVAPRTKISFGTGWVVGTPLALGVTRILGIFGTCCAYAFSTLE